MFIVRVTNIRLSKAGAQLWQSGGQLSQEIFLWPPCVADADIIFLPCGYFLYLLFSFRRLISAVADWVSAILVHIIIIIIIMSTFV